MISASEFLEKTFGEANTSIKRDLHLNFTKLMQESALDETERNLNLLAIATSLKASAFESYAAENLKVLGLSEEMIVESKESAAIMGMLNTYYKFKSYLSPETLENYSRAGLRMQSLGKPANGKEKFEQMSMAVSVVNGCPSCISSHEKALVQLGVSFDKIHDIARLASVVKGLSSLT